MKKFMISTVAAMALFMIAGSANAAVSAAEIYSSASGLLKVGSGYGAKAYQNVNVKAAQTALNACVAGSNLAVDGKFGPLTKGVFMSFQASKGIKVDGIIGAVTAGQLANCSGAASTSNGSTDSTVISGGAGNIQSIITLGSPSSMTVSEGDTNKSVLGIEVKADAGSDLKVSNIGIKIAKTSVDSKSTWVSRYINKISIMQGSTVIGSVDASALSQNGNDYTANIAVNNAVIKANMNSQFYVAVNGNSTLDSNDSNATLTATVTSVRYMDATGAVLTTSATNNQSFTLQKLSSSANVKVQVSEDNNNPRSRTVTSNYTSTTNDVSLLKFNVTAYGSNMNFNKITALATATGVSNVKDVSQLFKLKYNGNVISTVNLTSSQSGATQALNFGDTAGAAAYTATSLNGGSSLVIPAGQTAAFEILADIKPIATGGPSGTVFDAGDTLKVNLASSYVLNDWSVLDQSGNSIANNTVNRQGSATGYEATFRVQGLSSQLTSGAPVPNNVYNSTSGTYTASTVYMNVSVTAAGSDFFIPRTVAIATSASDSTSSASAGFLIATLKNDYTYASGAAGSGVTTGSVTNVSGATVDGSGNFKIGAGQTAVFQISANITAPTAASGIKYVQLNAVRGDIDSALGTIATYPTLPASSFQSAGTAAF